jgi:hypothetical protein
MPHPLKAALSLAFACVLAAGTAMTAEPEYGVFA